MKDLKNCPFCGSKDVRKYLTIGMKWITGCNNCGARTAEFDYSLDAVSSWDRRPEQDIQELPF